VKFLLVAWTAWACPGGGWFAPAWPAKLRPIICAPKVAFELYDPARSAAARARVAQLGDGAALYACRGLRACTPLSSWTSTVNFKEATP
jgi:hypothetical protein